MDTQVGIVVGKHLCWNESAIKDCHEDPQDSAGTQLPENQTSFFVGELRKMSGPSTPICETDAISI